MVRRAADSLSIDVSSIQDSDVTRSNVNAVATMKSDESNMRNVELIASESGKAPWVTVGGTDVEKQLQEADVDLEAGIGDRPKSSGF